jgi:carbonic anhydrase
MKFVSALLVTLVVLLSCRPIVGSRIINPADDAEFWNPTSHGHRFNLNQAADTFSYDYTSPRGPQNWGTAVDPACSGTSQSPIDISTSTFDPALQALNFNYRDFNGAIFFNNNGESLRVDFTDPIQSILSGGALQAGQTFRITNIHFHTGSDHTVNGGAFPLEMHIVHQNTNPALAQPNNTNELTVVSLLFRLGDANPWLQPFVDQINAGLVSGANLLNPGAARNLTGTLRLLDVLPNPAYYYTYPGSLTTPGCRQTVTWHVLRTTATASGAQIQALRSPFANFPNARPTQPLNNRLVRTNLPFSVGTVANPGVGANSPVVNINFANIYPAARV